MSMSQWQRLAQDLVFDRCPLYRIRAEVPSDYMVVWSFLCTIMGHLGFEKVLKEGVWQWGRNGSTLLLQEQLQCLHPRFSGWAGPQFEQGGLNALRALSSSTAAFIDLPGCIFMHHRLPLPTAAAVDAANEQWTHYQPPALVHGMCLGGKRHLLRLWEVRFFRTLIHARLGHLAKPCVHPAPGDKHVCLGPSLMAQFTNLATIHPGVLARQVTLHQHGLAWHRKVISVGDTMKASWATVLSNPAEATRFQQSILFTYPGPPDPATLLHAQEDASQLAPPVHIACPGLGGSPIPGFEPDVSFLNLGSLQGYGPAQHVRDPYEGGFKPFPGDSALTASIRLVLADPALRQFMRKLTDGITMATEDPPRIAPLHAHLHAPCRALTIALKDILAMLWPFPRGPAHVWSETSRPVRPRLLGR